MILEKEIAFGLLPERDRETMTKILNAVCVRFPSGTINTFELGVHRGQTSRGIHNFFLQQQRVHFHIAIDNGADNLPMVAPYDGCHFIGGNSIEVYNELPNDSQHFGFIDANHSFPMTVIDFFCYCTKIRVDGFIALHDTGAHIKPFTDYQKIGSKSDRDMFISCRKAADALGLLNPHSYVNGCQFEKVYDIYDDGSHTGGILCLRRTK